MVHPMLAEALASARIRELRTEAERARLVARAKASHPAGSAWRGSDVIAAEEVRVVRLEDESELTPAAVDEREEACV